MGRAPCQFRATVQTIRLTCVQNRSPANSWECLERGFS